MTQSIQSNQSTSLTEELHLHVMTDLAAAEAVLTRALDEARTQQRDECWQGKTVITNVD